MARNHGMGRMPVAGHIHWRDFAWMSDMIGAGRFANKSEVLREAMSALAEKMAGEDEVAAEIYARYEAMCNDAARKVQQHSQDVPDRDYF
ncbi:hypothetical protein ACVOZ6_004681 [Escherichia coli]